MCTLDFNLPLPASLQAASTTTITPDDLPTWQAQVEALYRQKGMLRTAETLARRVGIPAQDTEDICQESFLILSKCMSEGRFNGTCKLPTYFLAIVKWRAIAQMRPKKHRFVAWTPDMDNLPSEPAGFLKEEINDFLEFVLEGIGERRKLILLWSQQGFSMKEIAGKLGYKNADVAKKEACLGRRKLKEFVLERPYLKEALAIRA